MESLRVVMDSVAASVPLVVRQTLTLGVASVLEVNSWGIQAKSLTSAGDIPP